MKGFISHIVDQLPSDDLSKFRNQAFVFPSRRACYYFREALLKRFPGETFWVPNILSIEAPDRLDLVKVMDPKVGGTSALYQALNRNKTKIK